MTHQSQAAAQSWERAKHLAKLAGIKPGAARNYISTHKNPVCINLLDQKGDSRNQVLKAYIQDAKDTSTFNNIITSTQNRAKGDPTQPPRAGAPPRNTLIQTDNNIPTNNIKLLQTLKKLADKNGGLQGLRQALQDLENLQI